MKVELYGFQLGQPRKRSFFYKLKLNIRVILTGAKREREVRREWKRLRRERNEG